MGKYLSITCPECGGKIRKKLGYSVQEIAELEKKGICVLTQYEDSIITCPHCGALINTETGIFNGPDDVVAFFD